MTQEQYAQMMAQQQMAQQAQGPAMGGFMGGLLDSATAGLLPNSLYENPQDPTNRDSAQLGGLLGMIIPALLGKWGGGALARNLASKIDPKTASGIARWMLGAGQGEAQAANALYRQDMLGGLLGGALGGGMAEGPLGMLLGAGIGGGATYMNRASDAGELGLMKMFDKTKDKVHPKLAENMAKQTAATDSDEIIKNAKSIYNAETKAIDLTPIHQYTTKFDETLIGKVEVENGARKLTARDLILNKDSEEVIRLSPAETVTSKVGDKTKTGVRFLEPVETTYKKLYDDFVKELFSKRSNKKTILDNWLASTKGTLKRNAKDEVSHVNSLATSLGKRYPNAYNADVRDIPFMTEPLKKGVKSQADPTTFGKVTNEPTVDEMVEDLISNGVPVQGRA